jgi:hypothetical protein
MHVVPETLGFIEQAESFWRKIRSSPSWLPHGEEGGAKVASCVPTSWGEFRNPTGRHRGHRLVQAMMQEIVFQEGAIEVDARVLAGGLGLDVASLQEFVREGKITSRCERGVDNDLGRHRLTFFYGNRRLRLVVGQAGNVIWQSTIDFGDHSLPAAMHKPGP